MYLLTVVPHLKYSRIQGLDHMQGFSKMFSLGPNARTQFSVHFVFFMQILGLNLHICIQKKVPLTKKQTEGEFRAFFQLSLKWCHFSCYIIEEMAI